MFKKTFKTSTSIDRRSSSAGRLLKREPVLVINEKYRRCVDPNEVDLMGRTNLHRAVLQTVDSDTSLAEALLAGCDVNASDKYGRRAIHYAAKRGHVKCIRKLISVGALVDVVSKDGLSPLMEATKRSQLEALKVLVQAGADVNRRNEKGEAAIHYAACSSEFECVEVLAKAKANLNVKDNEGNTALILAVKRSDEKVIKALISARVNLNGVDDFGRTALHYAAEGNHPLCAGMLIQAGASIDIDDKKGNSPFVTSIRKNSVETLQVLMDSGCDRMSIDGIMGTALSLAAVLGHSSAVQVLIRNGEDADESGYFGMTPLMLSTYESQVETVNVLLRNGANSNAKGRIGCSPLRAALLNVNPNNEVRRHNIIAMLIRSGIKINIRHKGKGLFVGCTNGNNSPLSFALSIGYISAVRMLLIAGSDVPLQEVLDWMKSINLWRFYDVKPLTGLLYDWVSEPRSLKYLCRSTIRSSMSPYRIEESITRLPIARTLQRYINYEELDYIEVEKAPVVEGGSQALQQNLNLSPCGLRMLDGSILHLINSQTETMMPSSV